MSDGPELGWNISYYQDTFSQDITAVGHVTEIGQVFDSGTIYMLCDAGELSVGFSPKRLMMFTDTVSAQFKSGDTTEEITVVARKFPIVGNRLAASSKDNDRFMNFLLKATQTIAFKSDDKQGKFPIVGLKKVFSILKSECTSS